MEDQRDLMHQAMLERMQMAEEAIERARAGEATEEDWALIRMECGLPVNRNLNKGEKYELSRA